MEREIAHGAARDADRGGKMRYTVGLCGCCDGRVGAPVSTNQYGIKAFPLSVAPWQCHRSLAGLVAHPSPKVVRMYQAQTGNCSLHGLFLTSRRHGLFRCSSWEALLPRGTKSIEYELYTFDVWAVVTARRLVNQGYLRHNT